MAKLYLHWGFFASFLLFSMHNIFAVRGNLNVRKKASCTEMVVPKNGGSDSWRYAKKGEFPWAVSLQHTEEIEVLHFCGGSLASLNLVLTACHCLVMHSLFDPTAAPYLRDTKNKVAVAGSANNNRSDPCYFREVVGISKFVIHPKCRHFHHEEPDDRGGWDYDFGIVVLKKNLTLLDGHIAPFRMVSWNKHEMMKDLMHKMVNKEKCIVIGWGRRQVISDWANATDAPEVSPHEFWPLLTVIEVTLSDFAYCYNVMCTFDPVYCEVDHWARNHVCATSYGSFEVCNGDSGGPLMCGPNNYVYGLVGWGPSCGRYKVPSMYPTIMGAWDFVMPFLSRNGALRATDGVTQSCCSSVASIQSTFTYYFSVITFIFMSIMKP